RFKQVMPAVIACALSWATRKHAALRSERGQRLVAAIARIDVHYNDAARLAACEADVAARANISPLEDLLRIRRCVVNTLAALCFGEVGDLRTGSEQEHPPPQPCGVWQCAGCKVNVAHWSVTLSRIAFAAMSANNSTVPVGP